MQLKHGVRLADLSPQIALAAVVIEAAYRRHELQAVVTSVNDGKHSTGSLHYRGRAIDIRLPSRCLPTPGRQAPALFDSALDKRVAEDVRAALGEEFDTILETHHENKWNWHLHVEYDPHA